MDNAFNGKTVVLTGGTAGIGLAAARKFADGGATVFITGRDRDRLDAAVSALPGDVIGVHADSASLEDLDRLSPKSSSAAEDWTSSSRMPRRSWLRRWGLSHKRRSRPSST